MIKDQDKRIPDYCFYSTQCPYLCSLLCNILVLMYQELLCQALNSPIVFPSYEQKMFLLFFCFFLKTFLFMEVNTQYLWSQKLALPTCRKEENKTQERLSNLPKVTQLHSGRATHVTEAQTHWPQVSCIQISDTFAGGGWGPTAGRVVESQLCNQGLNSHLCSEKCRVLTTGPPGNLFPQIVFFGYFFFFFK